MLRLAKGLMNFCRLVLVISEAQSSNSPQCVNMTCQAPFLVSSGTPPDVESFILFLGELETL